MKKNLTLALIALMILTMSACATHQDVLGSEIFKTVESKQQAGKVAVCITRNSDDYFVDNTMLAKVVYIGQEPYEVEMKMSGSQYATVRVSSTVTGSKADFYFSRTAKLNFPQTTLDILTKGCL